MTQNKSWDLIWQVYLKDKPEVILQIYWTYLASLLLNCPPTVELFFFYTPFTPVSPSLPTILSLYSFFLFTVGHLASEYKVDTCPNDFCIPSTTSHKPIEKGPLLGSCSLLCPCFWNGDQAGRMLLPPHKQGGREGAKNSSQSDLFTAS